MRRMIRSVVPVVLAMMALGSVVLAQSAQHWRACDGVKADTGE